MSKMNEMLKKHTGAATEKESTLEKKMRAAGYLPAAEVAAKVGMHLGSVYRWLDEQQVKTLKAFGKRFVSRASLIDKVGVEQATILGFIAPKAAEK